MAAIKLCIKAANACVGSVVDDEDVVESELEVELEVPLVDVLELSPTPIEDSACVIALRNPPPSGGGG
jgi:hypothetical protein